MTRLIAGIRPRDRETSVPPLDRPSVPQIKGETNELISPMKRGGYSHTGCLIEKCAETIYYVLTHHGIRSHGNSTRLPFREMEGEALYTRAPQFRRTIRLSRSEDSTQKPIPSFSFPFHPFPHRTRRARQTENLPLR